MEKKRDTFFLTEKKQKKSDKHKHNVSNSMNQKNNHSNTNKPEVDGKQKQPDNKKTFDKKAYRLKKYSKKYKLEQWEEQRKKSVLRKYYKEIKNEFPSGTYKPVKFDEDNVDSSKSNVGRYVKHPDLIENDVQVDQTITRKDPYWKAKEKFSKIKEDKLKKQKEMEKAKEEKMRRLQEYKKKKQERYKKLSKKTKKGQPVMTGRMELLLEKIQSK